MPSRTAKFVSALFASLLAGAALTTASHGAPAEAEKCLSGPQGAVPAGRPLVLPHRARHQAPLLVHRRREGKGRARSAGKFLSFGRSRFAAEKCSRQAAPSRTRAPNCPRRRRGPSRQSASRRQRTAAAPANAAGTDTSQRASVSDTPITRIIGDCVALAGTIGRQPVGKSGTGRPAATYQSASRCPTGCGASAARPPLPRSRWPRRTSSAARQTGSIQILLIAIIGALALAGLIGSAIFRFGSMRADRQARRRGVAAIAARSGIRSGSVADRLTPSSERGRYRQRDISRAREDGPRGG